MAQLTWRSILSDGSRELHDNNSNDDIDFELTSPPVDSAAALLILAAKNVHEERSFITINQDGFTPATTFVQAQATRYFVSRILSTGSHFVTQVHRVQPGLLTSGDNKLWIHARDADGTVNGNIDNFEVARIFLVYFTPD